MISTLGYITWNVSPFIYEGEHFAIGWYGTLMTLSSVFILLTYYFLSRHDKQPIQFVLSLFVVTLISTYFFGHMFHGLFYEWYYSPHHPWYFLGVDWDYRNHYFDHPHMFLTFNHGGFASHGCIFGGICTSLFFLKRYKISFLWLFDRIMIASCSMLFVRIGNLINSEIYGLPTSLPWGFVFEQGGNPCHPTQIYEIIIFLIAYIVGWILFYKRKKMPDGFISGIVLLLIFIPRFMVEFLKNPQFDLETNWLLNMGQYLSIPYIVYGLLLLFITRKKT